MSFPHHVTAVVSHSGSEAVYREKSRQIQRGWYSKQRRISPGFAWTVARTNVEFHTSARRPVGAYLPHNSARRPVFGPDDVREAMALAKPMAADEYVDAVHFTGEVAMPATWRRLRSGPLAAMTGRV